MLKHIYVVYLCVHNFGYGESIEAAEKKLKEMEIKLVRARLEEGGGQVRTYIP